MAVQLSLTQLEEWLQCTHCNTPRAGAFHWITSWLICVPTKESLLISKVIQLFQSSSILNGVTWNKHWLASVSVLEPSHHVWTGSITVLLQLRQLHSAFSLLLGLACPVWRLADKAVEKEAAQSHQQLAHSIPTSRSTQQRQALRNRAKVSINYHFILLARRS